MPAIVDVEDKRRRKELFARMVHATGWSYAEVAERMQSLGKISEGSVRSFLKKDPVTSNAPKAEKLKDLARLVVDQAREIIADAALQETMTPLTREEFEQGVELTHGRVPGIANMLDMAIAISADGGNIHRASLVGSTGRLGHISVPLKGQTLLEARRRILDAAWSAYEKMTTPKSMDDMHRLIESTIQLVSAGNGENANHFWTAEVYGRNGRLKVVARQSESEILKSPTDKNGDVMRRAAARIADVAYMSYEAALRGVDARLLYPEERAAKKSNFRELRRVFNLDFETIAEITGRGVKTIQQWTDDTKDISPNAGVYDVLQSYRQSWASDILLAASVGGSTRAIPHTFIDPRLPVDYRDVMSKALSINAKALSEIPHWKTAEKMAVEAGFTPKALRRKKTEDVGAADFDFLSPDPFEEQRQRES